MFGPSIGHGTSYPIEQVSTTARNRDTRLLHSTLLSRSLYTHLVKREVTSAADAAPLITYLLT